MSHFKKWSNAQPHLPLLRVTIFEEEVSKFIYPIHLIVHRGHRALSRTDRLLHIAKMIHQVKVYAEDLDKD